MAKLNTDAIHDMLTGKGRDRRVIGNNTVAARTGDGVDIMLHGHTIATIWPTTVTLTLAGWGTVTTRDRLNTLGQVFARGTRFFQRKGDQFVTLPDGDTRAINPFMAVVVTRDTRAINSHTAAVITR